MSGDKQNVGCTEIRSCHCGTNKQCHSIKSVNNRDMGGKKMNGWDLTAIKQANKNDKHKTEKQEVNVQS